MRRLLIFCVVAAAAVAAGAWALSTPGAGQTATVTDGDTIVVGREKIRIWGIDAPEGRQLCRSARGQSYACGDIARDKLKTLLGMKPVACRQRDRDRYDRSVSQCRVGGVDVGDYMVRTGWAVDYRRYSQGAYARAQAEAKLNRRGIWGGTFEMPSEWRADARATIPAPPQPPGRCAIKGNVNAKGRHIYHRPGQRDYTATVISPDRGERWFCTEAEAKAAGWTPAQR